MAQRSKTKFAVGYLRARFRDLHQSVWRIGLDEMRVSVRRGEFRLSHHEKGAQDVIACHREADMLRQRITAFQEALATVFPGREVELGLSSPSMNRPRYFISINGRRILTSTKGMIENLLGSFAQLSVDDGERDLRARRVVFSQRHASWYARSIVGAIPTGPVENGTDVCGIELWSDVTRIEACELFDYVTTEFPFPDAIGPILTTTIAQEPGVQLQFDSTAQGG